MFINQPNSDHRQLGSLTWFLVGEWLFCESYIQMNDDEETQRAFNSVHLSLLIFFNWIIFLFLRDADGDSLGSATGPAGERSKLVGGF